MEKNPSIVRLIGERRVDPGLAVTISRFKLGPVDRKNG